MKHIDSLGHTFCIRLKRNIKVLVFDKHEGHSIWKYLDSLNVYKYHSYFLHNIPLSSNRFIVNIAFSKSNGTLDPWIIVTNADPERAIKDYGYRFGSIESIFKSQKSNGFYLENTVNASLKYFETMYMVACFSILFLTIFGADYSKNSKCYKHHKIITHISCIKNGNKSKFRSKSLFNTGLTLFKLAFNSPVYIRIPFNLILYDI